MRVAQRVLKGRRMFVTKQLYRLDPRDVSWLERDPCALDLFVEHGDRLGDLTTELAGAGLTADEEAEWVTYGFLCEVAASETRARLEREDIEDLDLGPSWRQVLDSFGGLGEILRDQLVEGGRALVDADTRIVDATTVRTASAGLRCAAQMRSIPEVAPSSELDELRRELIAFIHETARRGDTLVVRTTWFDRARPFAGVVGEVNPASWPMPR
ncbi:MAG TPA: hypothetical protein VMZ28_21435 [Kofleriaceae bacterium]|nr:hypothetical protein [Kofleriaceae bacterium]